MSLIENGESRRDSGQGLRASGMGAMFACVALLGGCPRGGAGGDAGDDAGAGSDDAGASDAADVGAPPEDAEGGGEGDGSARVTRLATLVMAAPDLAPQFVCFLSFAPAADGSPQGSPVAARGPWGVPDPADPNAGPVFGPAGLPNVPVKLTSGFPYGAILRLGIRERDAPAFDDLAGVLLLVERVDAPVFAGGGVDSTTCRDAWNAADAPSRPRFVVRRGQIGAGQSWLAAVSGCASASADPQCAGGNNLTETELALDLGAPSAYAGVDAGDVQLAIQVANLAPYPGYQDVDVYLQPMTAGAEGGAAAVPDGLPVPLTAPGESLRWGQIAAHAAGVRLSSADEALAQLLVVPHGQPPGCAGGPACGTSVAIPVAPFMAAYAPTAKAAWAGRQVFVLFGRPPLAPGEDATGLLRLGIFDSAIP